MKYIHMIKPVILIGLTTAMLFFTPKTIRSQIQVNIDGISYICFDNYIDYNNGLIFLGDCHGTISEISVTESYNPWDGGGGGSSSSNEPWYDSGGSSSGSSGGSSSSSGGTYSGTSGTNDNNTHEDNLLCPCCGSSAHTNCECEVCSQSFNPLKCLNDQMPIFVEQKIISWGYRILIGTIYITIGDDPLVSLLIGDNLNQDIFDLYAGLSYRQGILYNWYGTIFFNCLSKIITKAALTNSSIRMSARPIEGTSNLTLRKVIKSSGEIIDYDIFPVTAENVIPLHLIDRYGWPAIGQKL